VALLCVVAGLYAFSGAGLIRRLPLLRTGLLVIGLVSLLRGIAFVLLLLAALGILPSQGPVPGTAWWSSLWFLLISLSYLVGLASAWRSLSRPAPERKPFATPR
jgi:hypothetical protein